MDVLIDWETLPWKQMGPGVRVKVSMRGGKVVTLLEVSDGAGQEWCTKGHLIHVLDGEATARLRDGDAAIPLRAGDTGILLDGEVEAHTIEPAAGGRIQILLFEQPLSAPA
jgi:hypothetical protein